MLHTIPYADTDAVSDILEELTGIPSKCGYCEELRSEPIRCGISGKYLTGIEVTVERPEWCPKRGIADEPLG